MLNNSNSTQPNKQDTPEARQFMAAFIPDESPPTRLEILSNLIGDHPISRRQLIPNLLAAITLGRLAIALPFPPMVETPADSTPYGPPERTATIDQWLGRIDEMMAGLSEYRRVISDARALPPAEVDGMKLVNLENKVHDLSDDLIGHIECDYEHDLISATTGRAASAVCIEAELVNRLSERPDARFGRDFWQREVDACGRDHPEETARLQAALNASFGGVI